MSGTDSKRLQGDTLGRVIALLRRELTHDEIKSVLERRYPRWREADREYTFNQPRVTRWGCRTIDDAMIRFSKKHRRWARWKDMGVANRLPSPNVFNYHNNPNHWCRWDRHSTDWRPPHPIFWERIISRASELTSGQVLAIPNQTIRRDAIMAWGGVERLVREGEGTLQQQDDYGMLWRVRYAEPNTGDWFSMFVEVVNSTANPDGTYDRYFLRVPTHITSAMDGVAWTGHFDKPRFSKDPPTMGPTGSSVERKFVGFRAES